MASTVLASPESSQPSRAVDLDRPAHPLARVVFAALIVAGFGYAGISVFLDTQQVGEQLATGVFLFLALALLIALGFEFVNGFHDTANAVATVIYTNAMPANMAVMWSGFFNFLGVMLSSGAVAYSIVTLLPIDLVLNVGSGAGFAMIFALLLAAVMWNLATWYVGLPNSSSHTLIGSVLGVGVANQLLHRGAGGASLDWSQATKVLTGLWMAPLIGFGAAMLMLVVLRAVARNPTLMQSPEGDAPPPRGIRALLVFTCTAVSFSHGSNDGQKGMGLIMLILIGCAPTAYALNRTLPASATPAFYASATTASQVLERHGAQDVSLEAARRVLMDAVARRAVTSPAPFGATVALSRDVAARVASYGSLDRVPASATPNLRNDMYLVLDATRLIVRDAEKIGFAEHEVAQVKDYQQRLEAGTRYIPLWVKVAVALALGLGTMIGWKRIVVTVGEKIGKQHMTYGMGAAAELVAAGTILAADRFGLPVSTTHILSSGVAGASIASGIGLQRRTLVQLAAAWLMTLPVAMLLSGTLYWLLLHLVGSGTF